MFSERSNRCSVKIINLSPNVASEANQSCKYLSSSIADDPYKDLSRFHCSPDGSLVSSDSSEICDNYSNDLNFLSFSVPSDQPNKPMPIESKLPSVSRRALLECQNDVSKSNQQLLFLNWNIEGLTNHKLHLHYDLLKLHDFVLLTETWTEELSDFNLEGFVFKNFHRTTKDPLARRNSGGMCIFLKSCMSKGIELAFKKREWIIWSRLKKDFFNFDHDVYLACIYLPPAGSKYEVSDPFTIMRG